MIFMMHAHPRAERPGSVGRRVLCWKRAEFVVSFLTLMGAQPHWNVAIASTPKVSSGKDGGGGDARIDLDGVRPPGAPFQGPWTDRSKIISSDQQVEAEADDNAHAESTLTKLFNYFMETNSYHDGKTEEDLINVMNQYDNHVDVEIYGGLENSNVGVTKAKAVSEPSESRALVDPSKAGTLAGTNIGDHLRGSHLVEDTKPFTFVDGMDRLKAVSQRLRADKNVNPADLLVEVKGVAQDLLRGLLLVQEHYEKGDNEGAAAALKETVGPNLEYFVNTSRGMKAKSSKKDIDIVESSGLDDASPYNLEKISNVQLAEFLQPQVFDEQIEIVRDAVNILDNFDLSLLSSQVDKDITHKKFDSGMVSTNDDWQERKDSQESFKFESNAFDFEFAGAQTTFSHSRGHFRPQNFDHSSLQSFLYQHKSASGNQLHAQKLRKMSSLFQNNQDVMARHELRMSALGNICRPECAETDLTCNCKKLFQCVNSMTEYDLAVLVAGGFIDRTPTSLNYANFTVSVDDLSLFDADGDIVERLAQIKADAVDHSDTVKCTAVLQKLYTGCDPSKVSCSNPNTESFQVSIDQVCSAVNTKTKLLFEVIGDEFDGFVDKGVAAKLKPLSFDVCREFIATFDMLYEVRPWVYFGSNPMRKSGQYLHSKTIAQTFQHTQFPVRNWFNKNPQTGIVDRTFDGVAGERWFTIVNPASGKMMFATSQTTKAITYDADCGEKVSLKTHDPSNGLQHFKLVGDQLVPKSCSGYRLTLVGLSGSACFDGAIIRLKSASSTSNQQFRVRRDETIVSVKCPNLAMSAIDAGTLLDVEDPSLIAVSFFNPASRKVLAPTKCTVLQLQSYDTLSQDQYFHLNRISGQSFKIISEQVCTNTVECECSKDFSVQPNTYINCVQKLHSECTGYCVYCDGSDPTQYIGHTSDAVKNAAVINGGCEGTCTTTVECDCSTKHFNAQPITYGNCVQRPHSECTPGPGSYCKYCDASDPTQYVGQQPISTLDRKCATGNNVKVSSMYNPHYQDQEQWIISPEGVIELDSVSGCSKKAIGFNVTGVECECTKDFSVEPNTYINCVERPFSECTSYCKYCHPSDMSYAGGQIITLRDKQTADPTQQFIPVSDEIIFRPAAGNLTQLWEFDFVNPPYDFAVLPGFPGNVKDGSLSSAADIELSRSAMHSCDRSMALLVGSQMSLGTLRAIVSDVKANGAERMPGECCFDTPTTNQDHFGVEFDPDVMTCTNHGLWHLGISEGSCNNAGGKWFRSPCVTLKECIDGRPKRFDPNSPQAGTCQAVLKRLSIGFVSGRSHHANYTFDNTASGCSNFCRSLPEDNHQVGMMTDSGDKCICMYNEGKVPDQVPDYATRSPPKFSLVSNGRALGLSHEAADCTADEINIEVQDYVVNSPRQLLYLSYEGQLVSAKCPQRVFTAFGNGSLKAIAPYYHLDQVDKQQQQWVYSADSGSISNVKYQNLVISSIKSDDSVLDSYFFSLVNQGASLTLGVEGDNCTEGQRIVLQTEVAGSLNQKFKLGDDNKIISMKCPSFAISVPFCTMGTAIYLHALESQSAAKDRWQFSADGKIKSLDCSNMFIGTGATSRAQFHFATPASQVRTGRFQPVESNPQVAVVPVPDFGNDTTTNATAYDKSSYNERQVPSVGTEIVLSDLSAQHQFLTWTQRHRRFTNVIGPYFFVNSGNEFVMGIEEGECKDGMTLSAQVYDQNMPSQHFYLGNHGAIYSAKCGGGAISMEGICGRDQPLKLRMYNDDKSMKWEYKNNGLLRSIKCEASPENTVCKKLPTRKVRIEWLGTNRSPSLNEVQVYNLEGDNIASSASCKNVGQHLASDEEPDPVDGECFPRGEGVWEVFKNIVGSNIEALTSNPRFPLSPDRVDILTEGLEIPRDTMYDYGSRLWVYITAPVSGSYTFWIASNNDGELWLSTSTKPSDKVKIAWVSGFTMYRQWDKYASQQSDPIELVGGQVYYLEAIHKKAMQGIDGVPDGDHLSVGWVVPGSTVECNCEKDFNHNTYINCVQGTHSDCTFPVYCKYCHPSDMSYAEHGSDVEVIGPQHYGRAYTTYTPGIIECKCEKDFIHNTYINCVQGTHSECTIPVYCKYCHPSDMSYASGHGSDVDVSWEMDLGVNVMVKEVVVNPFNHTVLYNSKVTLLDENGGIVEAYRLHAPSETTLNLSCQDYVIGVDGDENAASGDGIQLTLPSIQPKKSKTWKRENTRLLSQGSSGPLWNQEWIIDFVDKDYNGDNLMGNLLLEESHLNCYRPNPAFSTSFEEFARETLINDADEKAQCQHARQQLAFDADYPFDADVCDAFNKKMCDLEFTGVDHAMESLSSPPQFEQVEHENAEYERVEFKEEAFEMPPEYAEDKFPLEAIEEIANGEEWMIAEDEESSVGDSPSMACLIELQDAWLAFQLIHHAAERARMLLDDNDLCEAVPQTLPLGFVTIPNPAFIACVIVRLIGLGIVGSVLVAAEIASELLNIRFEKDTEGPDGVVYANNASRQTYWNLKNMNGYLKPALRTINNNMKNQHTSMRKHLQDRHWALETNIRRDIFDSQNDLGRGIVTAQNALGQAIVDSRNANGQAIVDARNANSDQHNAISAWLHENISEIYKALNGAREEFIGPLPEDQTFTPMVLSWPEGQPNIMDRLEHLEMLGTGIRDAVTGIEKTLTVGTSFKDKDGAVHGFEASLPKQKLDKFFGMMEGIEDSMTVRADSVEGKVDAMEAKLDAMQDQIDEIKGVINAVENKMQNKMDGVINAVENKVDDMENKMDDVGNKIDDMTELISRVMQQNMKVMEALA